MCCQMHIQDLVKHVRCTSILGFDSGTNERGLNQREFFQFALMYRVNFV